MSNINYKEKYLKYKKKYLMAKKQNGGSGSLEDTKLSNVNENVAVYSSKLGQLMIYYKKRTLIYIRDGIIECILIATEFFLTMKPEEIRALVNKIYKSDTSFGANDDNNDTIKLLLNIQKVLNKNYTDISWTAIMGYTYAFPSNTQYTQNNPNANKMTPLEVFNDIFTNDSYFNLTEKNL